MRTYAQSFSKDELLHFLRAVDGALSEPIELTIIGGAAAALHYGATQVTNDIDTWDRLTAVVLKAVREATEKTGLKVPVNQVGIAECPYFYQERLVKLKLRFKRLVVRVPERHDLALMKMARGTQHDLAVLEQMHIVKPFDLDTLLVRFEEEMGETIAPDRVLRPLMRMLIERLFGTDAGKKLKRKRGPGTGSTRV
jgi:hypothetical protein